jgi:hypothetical protein
MLWGLGQNQATISQTKKQAQTTEIAEVIFNPTSRQNWALAPVFTPKSHDQNVAEQSLAPFGMITPPAETHIRSILSAEHLFAIKCTQALVKSVGNDDCFQSPMLGPELVSPKQIQHSPKEIRHTPRLSSASQDHHNQYDHTRISTNVQELPCSPTKAENIAKSQRSLREVFAHIQNKIEHFVRTHVKISIAANDIHDNGFLDFVGRCTKFMGNAEEASKILHEHSEFHGSLVSGLIWQLAAVLIFHESLMDTFKSQHILQFKEAWFAEAEDQHNPFADLHKTALERASIASQIVIVPGFWSTWRYEKARELAQHFHRALSPAWHTAQSVPATCGSEVFVEHQAAQRCAALETIVRLMLEVVVRLRQDPRKYELQFPRYLDAFDSESMVCPNAAVGQKDGTKDASSAVVLLTKSPCLVVTEMSKKGQGASVRRVEYKAELHVVKVKEKLWPKPASRRVSR